MAFPRLVGSVGLSAVCGSSLSVFGWHSPPFWDRVHWFLCGVPGGSDGGSELRPIRRAAKAVPLTPQELLVRDLLETLRLPYEAQVFVELSSGPVIVDFRIGSNVLLECSCSMGRRSSSLGFLRRAAAFVDWKFREIRRQYGGAYRMMVLFEGPNLDYATVKQALTAMFEHADLVFFDIDEVAGFLTNKSETEEDGAPESASSGQQRLDQWSQGTPSVRFNTAAEEKTQ